MEAAVVSTWWSRIPRAGAAFGRTWAPFCWDAMSDAVEMRLRRGRVAFALIPGGRRAASMPVLFRD